MSSLNKLKNRFKQILHLAPALKFVWQGAPKWTSIQVVLLIIEVFLPIALLYLTKLTIDTVTESITLPDKTQALSRILLLLALTGLTTWLSNIVRSVSEFVTSTQAEQVADYMQAIVHRKSVEIDLAYYENAQYLNTLRRAQEEAAYRPTRVLQNLTQAAKNSLSLLAMMGVLFSLHWGITIVVLLTTVPALIVRLKYANTTYQWQRQRTEMSRQSDYLSWLITGDSYAKEVRLFGLGNLFNRRFSWLRQQLYREKIKLRTRQTIASLIAQSFSTVLMVGTYGFIIYQTLNGVLRLGDLVIYREALQRGQDALSSLSGSFSSLYEDSLFFANLYEFLELQPQITSPPEPQDIPQPMRSGIVFDRVNFQYAGSQRQALRDISLTIKPGEVVAFVGENGSGKTTLIKLLCRLYQPTSGNISIDGIDLAAFDLQDLRRQISVVFQDYVKYHLSARENIWLGNVEVSADSANLIAAAQASGADAVIQQLPQAYDTLLGAIFSDGEELSVGQWQKIALARAFFRNAPIVVLDEPTSAIDPKAEYEVFEQFRQLIHNQTAILISHRLSTVRMADRIYVMDNGSIIESGNHRELMKLGGTYAKLFEIQAMSYR